MGKCLSTNKVEVAVVDKDKNNFKTSSIATTVISDDQYQELKAPKQNPVVIVQSPLDPTIPEHLQYGLRLAGMKELYKKLPKNALEEMNDSLVNNDGTLIFPQSDFVNGYVNQYFIQKWGKKDNFSVCERLQKGDKAKYVGFANVFVCWALSTPMDTLFDALDAFIQNHNLPEEKTFFWICDYVVRQSNVKEDLKYLSKNVEQTGHTLLLLEPWSEPEPLNRAYCIKEMYDTIKSNAKFDIVMSRAQMKEFSEAVQCDLQSVIQIVSELDLRNAKCRVEEEEKQIIAELDNEVGISKCNEMVIELIENKLVEQKKKALNRFSDVNSNETDGEYEKELIPLYEETLAECKEEHGNYDTKTLIHIQTLAELLREQGMYKRAIPHYEEALAVSRTVLGDLHPDTLASINSLATLLQDQGQLEKATQLYEEALAGCRETLGDRHPDTFVSMTNLALLLNEQGQNQKALSLYEEALKGSRLLLGDRNPDTLIFIHDMAYLLQNQGNYQRALVLFQEAFVGRREVLGEHHPHTLKTAKRLENLKMEIDEETTSSVI